MVQCAGSFRIQLVEVMQNTGNPPGRQGIVALRPRGPAILRCCDRSLACDLCGLFGNRFRELSSRTLDFVSPAGLPTSNGSRSFVASRFCWLPRTYTPCHAVVLNANVNGSNK